MRLKILLLSVLFSLATFNSRAQDTLKWTLPDCIQYALSHNPDLNQSILNKRMARLQYNQNRLSQLPSLSAGANYGKSYGRSIDPTSNQFINANYGFVGANGNLDVLLFGWFSKRKSIVSNQLTFESARADYAQLQNDISLNVATGFLRILLAKEQVGISRKQVQFSVNQMQQTAAFVAAGRSPELDLLQIKSQVATDSAAYYSAVNDYQHAILQLKAILNLDMATPFEIVTPPVNAISLAVLTQNTPEGIYEVAQDNFGSIKSGKLKIAAAQKDLASKKAALYPQLSFGFQVGTNFSSTQKDILNPHITGAAPSGDFISISGNQYLVMQPTVAYDLTTTPFFKQLSNNFRQTAVLSLSVPIFNGWVSQTAVKQAKIEIANQTIAEQKTEMQLKQDVYGAYYDAKAAAQKYYSTQNAATAADTALTFAKERYQLGLISTIDFLTTQNTTFKAESDAASAKYDLLFKLKVLDYYLNHPLKLN